MLAVARRIRPDLDWRQADAAELPFPNGSFDTVLCQAALMFFPDRVAALRNMARVAGPTGTVGLHVPGRLDHSPGYLALAEVAARHAGPDVIGLLGSYFAAGDPEQLTGTVRDAGLTIERMTTWTGATRLPSLTTFLDVELLPLADRIDQDTRARIDADCRTALTPFTDPTGAVPAPIEVHLLIAHPNGGHIAP
jgi:SAM-dependent methyltransferase